MFRNAALLVDTYVLLWALTNDERLTVRGKTLLTRATQVIVSAASLCEISIKAQIGKVTLPARFGAEALSERGYELLPVKPEHALAVRHLPLHHRDPVDRMLVVQAQDGDLTLVAHDRTLDAYDVTLELI
jgi:PIN domain nuclease of toxin-antitoxin system